MVPIGPRPIIWHLMKYYAHYGHKDFILCLGYKADVDQGLLPQLRRVVSNDFVLSDGGRDASTAAAATSTTGRSRSSTPVRTPSIGERLRRGREPYVKATTDVPRELRRRSD